MNPPADQPDSLQEQMSKILDAGLSQSRSLFKEGLIPASKLRYKDMIRELAGVAAALAAQHEAQLLQRLLEQLKVDEKAGWTVARAVEVINQELERLTKGKGK